MQNLELTLKSDVATTFRCTKAANSLDIDSSKKSIHHFKVSADVQSPYNVGLIVGASGSGKTTLAKHVWGEKSFAEILNLGLPVLDQFPPEFSYDECAAMLAGVGLTSVPCWIRPAFTLSNGQRARAECALQMARSVESDHIVLIDEWTSVVDRTVAKVMSHCIQKHARKTGKRIVLMSCHYDVTEWLNPDWVIDCNKQQFTDRRLLWRGFKRSEQLKFDVREVGRETWPSFSRYHYLSDKMPGGHVKTFGLFHGHNQIGFLCFANYVPHRKGSVMIMHVNRIVVHPDYAGLGLGIRFVNATSEFVRAQRFDVRCKFSSTPVFLAMKKDPLWKLQKVERKHATKPTGNMVRVGGFRDDVKTYSFKFCELPETLA